MVSDFGAAGGADIVLAAIAGVGGWGLAAGFPAGTATGCTCGNSSPTAVSRSATNSPIAAGLDASAGAGPVRAPAAAFVGAPARNSSPSDVSRSDTNSVRMPGFAGAQATGSGSGSGWGTDSGCGAGFTTATGAGSSTSTGSGATTGS